MAEKKRRKNERADGLIQVQVDYGRDPETGKRLRKYFYGKTKKEAEAKAEAFRNEQKLGIRHDAREVTVEQWAQEWLAIYKANISYGTRQNYEYALSVHILPAIGKMSVASVRSIDIQRVANALQDYSTKYINGVKSTLQQVFKTAAQNKLIITLPTDGVQFPQGTAGTHRALEEWEVEFIRQHWHGNRAGIWMMLMLYAGVRRGEMLALTWDDITTDALTVTKAVHFENNKPVLGPPKTKASERTIPIPPQLSEALTLAKSESNSIYICPSAKGTLMSQTALRYGVQSFLRYACGVLDKEVEFRCHDLRHPYVKHRQTKISNIFAYSYSGNTVPVPALAAV